MPYGKTLEMKKLGGVVGVGGVNKASQLFSKDEITALRKAEDRAVALRLGHLWSSALELAVVNPIASRSLGSQLLDLSITSGVDLPRSRAAVSSQRLCLHPRPLLTPLR